MDSSNERNALLWFSLPSLALLLSGCEVVGGIFKAGVWTGVIVVVLIALVVGGAFAFLRRT